MEGCRTGDSRRRLPGALPHPKQPPQVHRNTVCHISNVSLHRVGTLCVKVSAPLADAERIGQALAVAATAVAGGHEVSLWLAGDCVRLGTPGGTGELTALPEAADPNDLLATVRAVGRVTVCAPCAARRGITEADLLADVRLAGAASFVDEIMAEGARALVY